MKQYWSNCIKASKKIINRYLIIINRLILLTHINDHGPVSYTQPWKVTLKSIPTQGRSLHPRTPRRGMVEDPAVQVWDWVIDCQPLHLQASCVSSAALEKLSAVSLVRSFIRVFYQVYHIFISLSECLTLGLSQTWLQHCSTLKAAWIPFFIYHW